MNERLFGHSETREGPPTLRETTFNWLARGGRPEAARIRSWMEKWYQKYPADHQEELKRRLQSRLFGEFMRAYFELQVFSILHRLNCRVDVHPCFAGTEGTVDFLVNRDKGEKFYVEATVCGIGQGNMLSNANEEDVVRKIKTRLLNPHSDVWLSAEGELNTTLPKQRVVGPFQDLLNKYTADEVRRLCPDRGWEHVQRQLAVSIEEGSWRLKGYLAPPIASDRKGRVHGPCRGGTIDVAEPLARALAKKADHWKAKGLEEAVFLIALNVCHPEFWWGDETGVIFGNRNCASDNSSFSNSLSVVNGVVVFDHAVLGAERGSRVKLYQNSNMPIPECLRFLVSEKVFGDLLGF